MRVYVIIATMAFVAGWAVNEWRTGSERADALQNVRKIEQLEREKTAAVARAAAAQREKLEGEIRTVTKEVIRYVQSPDTGRCDLSDDWVRIHNQAAGMPRDAPPTSRTTDATDRSALAVVTENYAICRENMRRQSALIEWFKSL